MKEALANSTQQRLLYASIGLTLILIFVGVTIKVVFHENVIEFIALAVGKLFADNGFQAYRSVQVDGPIRQSYASLDVAKQAQEAGVPVMLPSNNKLSTWTPPAPQGENHQ